jgi:hypothetical protein
VILDRALADAEVCGDILARVASENHVHDLVLSRSEACDRRGRGLPRRKQLARIARLLERAIQAGKQFVAGNRLFDEIRGSGLHGFHRHRHVATAGDDDRGEPLAPIVKPTKQLNSVHSRKIGIKQETPFSPGAIGSKEILGTRKPNLILADL